MLSMLDFIPGAPILLFPYVSEKLTHERMSLLIYTLKSLDYHVARLMLVIRWLLSQLVSRIHGIDKKPILIKRLDDE